jgi:hypothetical protein
MTLVVCTSSQAALVTTEIGSSTSVLEQFNSVDFPANPSPGTQVTEMIGWYLVVTSNYSTVRYDPQYYSIGESFELAPVTVPVGTRVHEYTGVFDPETNELLSATWQTISENISDQTFEVGIQRRFLQHTGAVDPEHPPPPPEPVPLPPTFVLLGTALCLCLARKRRAACN